MEKGAERENGAEKGNGRMQLRKLFQRDNLIILILSGILLFIIALPTKEEKGTQTESPENRKSVMQGYADDGEADLNGVAYGSNAETENDYAVYLEQKLEKMLEGVSGVGKVSVMVTLQSSEELVVEKDAPVSRSNTTETDSAGGSRMISQMDAQETTIYRTEGNNSEPYVVKTILPKVEGVLVVAKGAGKGNVDKNITEIAQALFGVEAHKVKVVPMESDQ